MRRQVAVSLVSFVVFALAQARADIPEELLQEDPLGEISGEMTVVVHDLSDCVTGEPTQTRQTTIVGKLDKLIEELEKQCQACRGGGSNANPNKPLADSMIVGGPGGQGDLHAPKQGGKQWAALPPHERDRILQSMTEGFPPQYQKILERYYRNLAEEKPRADEPPPESSAPAEPVDASATSGNTQ